MTAWETLLDPFGYDFFVKGLVAAVLAGALCGLIGVFVTLRGMSYIGHGLSHAVFGGYAAAPLLGVPILLGAGLWGLASAPMRRLRATALIARADSSPHRPAPSRIGTPSRGAAAYPPKIAWDRPWPM